MLEQIVKEDIQYFGLMSGDIGSMTTLTLKCQSTTFPIGALDLQFSFWYAKFLYFSLVFF